MARTIPGVLPLPPLSNSQVQGGARGRVNVLTALAGTTRWLKEFTDGEVPSGDEQCGPNTAGSPGPGHTHAGGCLGAPLLHTWHSSTYGNDPDQYTTTVHGEAMLSAVTEEDAIASFIGTPRILFEGPIKTVMVPPCGPDGAYLRADMVVSVRRTAECLLRVSVRSQAGVTTEWTQALSSTVSHSSSMANSRPVVLVPGRRNILHVKMQVEYIAADATVALLSMGLHQRRTTA